MKLSELNFGKVEKDGEFNWLGLTAQARSILERSI